MNATARRWCARGKTFFHLWMLSAGKCSVLVWALPISRYEIQLKSCKHFNYVEHELRTVNGIKDKFYDVRLVRLLWICCVSAKTEYKSQKTFRLRQNKWMCLHWPFHVMRACAVCPDGTVSGLSDHSTFMHIPPIPTVYSPIACVLMISYNHEIFYG